MGLMARLKGRWRRHDERLVEEGLEARAAGVEGEDLSLVPGEDRFIESGLMPLGLEHDEAFRRDEVAEEEEPG